MKFEQVQINKSFSLSSQDQKVLVFLYQPVLGLEAYGFYNGLYELSNEKRKYSLRFLLDFLNLKEKKFHVNREKLESLGLIETYMDADNNYILCLKAPFSAKYFLTDTFLGKFLESEVGNSNFLEIISVFETEKVLKEGYKNITKKFDDLYQFSEHEVLKNIKIDDTNLINNMLVRGKLSYEEFVETLPRALKTPDLFNENFKQKILQLAFVYQFNINDLVEVYVRAHKGRKNISIEHLNLTAKTYFEKANKTIYIKEKTKTEEEVLENIPFASVIEKYGNKDLMSTSLALDTINTFITQNDIELGTLNVLLIFILKNKGGILPHVNYLNKVWESWSKNGVITASDAISYKSSLEKKYSTSTVKTKKINKPEWLDEYMKEIEEMEG